MVLLLLFVDMCLECCLNCVFTVFNNVSVVGGFCLCWMISEFTMVGRCVVG